MQKKQISANGVVRVYVDGRYRFWPSEVLSVPRDTMAPPTWGTDGNLEYKAPVQGARKSKRTRKKIETSFFLVHVK